MLFIKPIDTMEKNMDFVLSEFNRVVDSIVKEINRLETSTVSTIQPVAKTKKFASLGGDLLQSFSAKAYRSGRYTDHADAPADSFYVYDTDNKPYFKDINGTSTALF